MGSRYRQHLEPARGETVAWSKSKNEAPPTAVVALQLGQLGGQDRTTLTLDAPQHPSSFELDTMCITVEIGNNATTYAVDTMAR